MSTVQLLLRLTLSGTLMALPVLFLRPWFKKKLPPISLLVFWVMVLLFFLVPFRFSTPVSISYAVNVDQMVQAVEDVFVTPSSILESSQVEPALPSGGIDTLFLLWLAGTLLGAGYLILKRILLHRSFGHSESLESLPDITIRELRTLKRRTKIYVSDKVDIAMTYGVIHPKIYIHPSMLLQDRETLEYVLLHEIQHIRAFDTLFANIWLGLTCVFWFNPIVWLCRYFVVRDLEYLCDIRVSKDMSITDKAQYARTILQLTPVYRNNSLTLSFRSTRVADRISGIISHKKSSQKSWLTFIASVVILLSVVLPFSATTMGATAALSPFSTDYADASGSYILLRMSGGDFDSNSRFQLLGSYADISSAMNQIGFSYSSMGMGFGFNYTLATNQYCIWGCSGALIEGDGVSYILIRKFSMESDSPGFQWEDAIRALPGMDIT